MKFQTVVSRALSSVVRMPVLGAVFWCGISSCTVRHAAETSARVMSDLGLRSTATVTRTAFWSLPDHTVACLTQPQLSPGLQHDFPRLRLELSRALEAVVEEQFPGYRRADADAGLAAILDAAAMHRCDVLLRLGLRQVDDNLSSFTEMSDDYGLTEVDVGRDQLHLVLQVYDVGSGRLLDNLSVTTRSGWWRWRDHRVAELVEPALQTMLRQLRGRRLAGGE